MQSLLPLSLLASLALLTAAVIVKEAAAVRDVEFVCILVSSKMG